MTGPLVSIIIPTKNSGKTIVECIKSVKKQSYRNIETIVVDGYSTNGTREIAERYGAKVIQAKGERVKAKNVGLEHARGKYVLFIDSDMELTPKVVDECVKLAESDSRLGGIIIPERSVGNGYWAKVRDFERSFYAGTPIESARFFRRDIALQVGGFDEDAVFYEEATLPRKIERLGYNVTARIGATILHHEEDMTLAKLLKKRRYYAKTANKYLRKHQGIRYTLPQINPLYRYKLFLVSKRFWRKPSLAIGVLVLKTLEYLISFIGILM